MDFLAEVTQKLFDNTANPTVVVVELTSSASLSADTRIPVTVGPPRQFKVLTLTV